MKAVREHEREKLTDSSIEVAEVLFEVLINASPERTWQAPVNESSAWWHRDFYSMPSNHRFVNEQKLGGLMHEEWGGGEGQVWGVVGGLRFDQSLHGRVTEATRASLESGWELLLTQVLMAIVVSCFL